MSHDRFVRYWRGLLLAGIGAAAALWLAATGRLAWYVHPRYLWFTVAFCLIAVVAIVAAAPAVHRSADSTAPTAPTAPTSAHRTIRRLAGTLVSALLVGGTVTALLVVPPATLSTATAQQREVNAGAGAPPGRGDLDSTDARDDARDEQRDARDWSMLLRQNGGALVEGRSARFIGFVLAGPEAEPDVFYASRFVVSCCAVDAQPLGVPVLSARWEQDHPAGSWVEVSGSFVPNPDATSDQPVVLRPYTITPIAEPEDPYVY